MSKRIKENENYVKSESGAIVLDSKSHYENHMKMMNAATEKKQKLDSLENEVSELKKLVNDLIKANKEK